MYEYHAEILEIVDGDTLDVDVDLGMKVHTYVRVRLRGVDTPEIYGVKKDSPEYEAGMEAKVFLLKHVPPGTRVRIATRKDRKGKYGRYVADVFFTNDDGKDISVADLLVEEGHGKRSS